MAAFLGFKGVNLPSVWFYVGMAGAFCFILIQLVLLIDFAHSWNESWVEKMEEGNSRCWYAGELWACSTRHPGTVQAQHPGITVAPSTEPGGPKGSLERLVLAGETAGPCLRLLVSAGHEAWGYSCVANPVPDAAA